MRTRCHVPGRLPASVCSSLRSRTIRTGARAWRDNATATRPNVPSVDLEPKPPPIPSTMTRTRLNGTPNASASSCRTPAENWVDMWTVKPSARQSATIACGSRQQCVWTRVWYWLSTSTSACENPFSTSPRRTSAGPRTLPCSGRSTGAGKPDGLPSGTETLSWTGGAAGSRARSRSATNGNDSYSTRMSRNASSAATRELAATAATGAPT